jgi:hypothetical protein
MLHVSCLDKNGRILEDSMGGDPFPIMFLCGFSLQLFPFFFFNYTNE